VAALRGARLDDLELVAVDLVALGSLRTFDGTLTTGTPAWNVCDSSPSSL
jgi:hypothetical protein